MLGWYCEEQDNDYSSVCGSYMGDWQQPWRCRMCSLVAGRFRDPGIRTIAEYYHDHHTSYARKHYQNHVGKKQQ